MREAIGIMLMFIGTSMADSDNLLIPLLVITAGCFLLRKIVREK